MSPTPPSASASASASLPRLFGAAVVAFVVLALVAARRGPRATLALEAALGLALAAWVVRATGRLVDHAARAADRAVAAAAELARAAAAQASLLAETRRVGEAADAAARSKADFLANMSHEIRTPLAAVLGYADLLADPALGAAERALHVDTIRRNGEQLLGLVSDVLDFSKVDAGMMTVERIACAPAQIVHDVTSLLRPRAAAKGLAFTVRYDGAIPETVTSDPTRLRQVLMNLVGNAIKFTRTGGVTLTVRSRPAAAGPAELELAVADTGIGLTAEQVGGLFRPFAQADTSHTRRFGGTGLGLAICARLAELLGGRIDVASEPGRGSTFTLTVDAGPLDGVRMLEGLDERAGAPAPTPAAPPRSTLRLDCAVLLAEDGRDNQVLITAHLRRAGATVTVVEDGISAVETALAAHAAGRPFDVILMDMQMPELDGYGAAAELRRAGYAGPVVALTAHALVGDRERCLAAGCDDYLTKPVRQPQLVGTVGRWVGRSATEIAAAAPRPVGAPIQAAARATAPIAEPPLASSYADDPDMADLVARFVLELPARIAAIEEAARGVDPDPLRRLAHQLKGSAGGYGFTPITVAASELELAVVDRAPRAEVRRRIDALVALCRRARAPERHGSPTPTHCPAASTAPSDAASLAQERA